MSSPLLSEGDRPRVAAVVVTYHRPLELRQVVDGLLAQTRPPDHIIIFDNGGPVRANEILADYTHLLDILHSKINLGGAGGFAQALSYGLAHGADWVWLMDDDAVPQAEALECLLDTIGHLPSNVGALGSAVEEYGDVAVRHRRRFNRWTGWESSISRSCYGERAVEIDTCSFVGFLVRAEAAQKIPLPSAEFFLAYDDTDYSLRLQNAGWRLWLVPASVVVHLRTPESRLGLSDFGNKHYFNIRNRLIVKRRYARCRLLATLEGLGYGLLLWVRAGGWMSCEQGRLLIHAFKDGLNGRLGSVPSQSSSPGLVWSSDSSPETGIFGGTVIIRTQGKRTELLAEAIRSVRAQAIPLRTVLVVHADQQTLLAVANTLGKEIPNLDIVHAPDLSRNRGYPLNVGLHHVYADIRSAGFVAFLDDDDILYPRFGAAMAEALENPSIDVVYAASNRRELGKAAELAYHPLPVACLLRENFIPINAYAIRLGSLKATGLGFDETLEVLEDWNFLHRMLDRGFRFSPLSECLSEFRLTGDGNTPDKQDQLMWDRAWDGVHRFLDGFWQRVKAREIVDSLYGFDFSHRPPLSQHEQVRLKETAQLLWQHFPGEMEEKEGGCQRVLHGYAPFREGSVSIREVAGGDTEGSASP